MTITKNIDNNDQIAGLTEALPPYLLPYVYEVVNGKAIFYKGYKEAILLPNQPQEMGASSLQSFIISELMAVMILAKLRDNYRILPSELGLKIDKNDYRCLDIAIYEKSAIKLDIKYANTAPKIVIEVDVMADFSDLKTENKYIEKKTEDLLGFGVEKVIWVFSKTKTVLVATKNEPWQICKPQHSVNIIENCTFSLGEILEKV